MGLSSPRSYYGYILRHYLWDRNPQTASNDGIIVFGPDGGASVVSPQDVGGGIPASPNAPASQNPPVDPSPIAGVNPPVTANPPKGAPEVNQDPPGLTGDTSPQQVESPNPVGGAASQVQLPTAAVASLAPDLVSSAAASVGTPAQVTPSVTSLSTPSNAAAVSSETTISELAPTSSPLSPSSLTSLVAVSSGSSSSLLTTSGSSSVSSASASALTARASASSSASSSSDSSLNIGIVLACIAALGILAAFIAWLLRLRSKKKQQRLNTESASSWQSRGRKGSYIDYTPEIIQEKYYEQFHGGYTPALDPPPGIHLNDDTYPDDILDSYSSNNSPLPPSVMSATDITGRVPLQVTNMMPGDAYFSSDEASRPATSLAMLNTPPRDEYGTPKESNFSNRPRFLGLKDGGLDIPWAPGNRGRRMSSRLPLADLEQGIPEEKEEEWEPLPFPGEQGQALDTGQQTNEAKGKPSETATEAWTASLRANLANVLNMAGGYLAPSSHPQDKFTSMPSRSKRNSVRSNLGRRSLTRESTTRSNLYTLEEVEEGSGVVHIRGVDTPRATTPLSITKKPPSVMIKSRQRAQLCVPPSGTVTRASSVYSTASATSSVYDITSRAPRLPSIPPLSRTISMGTQNDASSADEALASRDSFFRKESRRQSRPKILKRLTSGCSATSVGSDMSRGSIEEERLTEEERMAQQALRERRKRVMGMGAGRGRPGTLRMGSVRTNSSRRSRGRGRR